MHGLMNHGRAFEFPYPRFLSEYSIRSEGSSPLMPSLCGPRLRPVLSREAVGKRSVGSCKDQQRRRKVLTAAVTSGRTGICSALLFESGVSFRIIAFRLSDSEAHLRKGPTASVACAAASQSRFRTRIGRISSHRKWLLFALGFLISIIDLCHSFLFL